MKKRYYYLIITILFFVSSIIYISTYYVYFFKILEETRIFLFTADFFRETISSPGGAIYYIGAFVEQFYYFPYLGIVIVALFLALIQMVTAGIFKLRGRSYILSFLPSVVLLLVQFEAAFQSELLIGFLISLLLLWGYIKCSRFKYSRIAAILIFIPLYLLISAYAVYSLALFVIYDILFKKGAGRFVFMAISAAVAVSVVFAASYLVYGLYPVYLSFTGLKNGLFVSEELYSKWHILTAFALIPLFLVYSRCLGDRGVKESGMTVLLPGISALIVYMGVAVIFVNPQLYFLTNQIESDRAANDENWDRLIEIAKRDNMPLEQEMQDINLAFCMKGVMGEKLFSVMQTSAERGLYSQFDEYSGVFAQKFAYHLGLYNMAYRWAYECNSSYGNAPRHLKKLLIISVINGEFVIALKYAKTLTNTLFYNDFAQKYIDYIDGNGDSETVEYINEKRKAIHRNNTVISELYDFGEVLRLYVNSNPDNMRAYNYYLAYLLLKMDLHTFVSVLPIHYAEGSTLPRNYEEAVIMYNMNTPAENRITRYKIPEQKEESFFEFIKKAQSGGPSAVKSYEPSFWFYAMFIVSQE